ncbi:MAG: hypothetical protein R3F35_24625 [Myxococcota bacterium]
MGARIGAGREVERSGIASQTAMARREGMEPVDHDRIRVGCGKRPESGMRRDVVGVDLAVSEIGDQETSRERPE